MHNIPAVIFAGGKSSRMGTDKALLPYLGYKTMSEFQYNKLQKYFNTVYISSKEDKFDFDCEVILDTKEMSSPLVALVSIFEQLQVESIFVLSVDAPLVDELVIEKILGNDDESYDAIIAKSPKGIQPLCGIYHLSILTQAQDALENDMHKLTRLLKEANTYTVNFHEETPFTNLNHKEEYEALLSSHL
jgi:molybdopterin-guanine dinucleotide biosynthesis protein A